MKANLRTTFRWVDDSGQLTIDSITTSDEGERKSLCIYKAKLANE